MFARTRCFCCVLSLRDVYQSLNCKAGASITYTIVVTNNGPSAADGATVSDSFPAALTGCTWSCAGYDGAVCTTTGTGNINAAITTFPPNSGFVIFTATCNVLSTATGSLSNTASVTAPSGGLIRTPPTISPLPAFQYQFCFALSGAASIAGKVWCAKRTSRLLRPN